MAKWLKAIGGNLCDNPDNIGFFMCSNCGVIHKGNKDKICPKCNSKMEVEQTENTENNVSKWVFQYENYQGDVYMCESCCQEVFFLHNIKPDFDFCPYCGAKMILKNTNSV